MLANPAPGLTFGALNLVGVSSDIANFGYTFEALGDDTDWGNPVPVDQKVISWLQDGAIIARKDYDNREILVRVNIRAATSAGLAAGESALMLETGKPNLLTWTAPDGSSPPCVFSVVMSNLEHVFDDLNEDRRIRTYGLRIQAEPFVRSSTLVTATKAAPTGTQTITTIDNCSSNTNWSQAVQPTGGSTTTTTPSVTGGTAINGTMSGYSATVSTRLALTRSSLATSLTGTPYIRIDVSVVLGNGSFANGTNAPSFKLNGIAAPVAIQTGSIYWFDASALGISTLTTVEITEFVIARINPSGSTFLTVADISRSNVLGDVGTKKQLSRTLPVAGSARTQGNLAVEDASASLGTALVYTYPLAAGAMAPPLRPYASAGGATTADATAVFGSNTVIDTTPIQFDIPVIGIIPGGHVLMARFKHASSGARTVTWNTRGEMGVGFTDLGVGAITSFTSVAGAWSTVVLGTVNLPTVDMGTNGKMYMQMLGSSGLLFDEAWIFNLDVGDLSWVECGTASPSAGGSANRLWLDAAIVQDPTPSAHVGFAADRSDQFAPSVNLLAFGQHDFSPPGVNVFTVTTNSTAAGLTLSHYPRWHTHAVT